MDYQAYRQQYFTDPPPQPRFKFGGLHGTTLYYEDYEQAVEFYRLALGEPAYVEGDSTKGWRVGDTWLTLLRGQHGNPQNVELMLEMPTPAEAVKLQQAFFAAGAQGAEPVDTLMYQPVRCCYVSDPLGTNIMIFSRLPQAGEQE